MTTHTTTTIMEYVRVAMIECGLGNAENIKQPDGNVLYNVRTEDGYKANLDVYFRLQFDLQRMDNPTQAVDELRKATQPLRSSVMASPMFKELEESRRELSLIVNELRPYKNHYEMAYQLLHGKKFLD